MPKILISKAFSFFILKFVLSLTNGTTYQEKFMAETSSSIAQQFTGLPMSDLIGGPLMAVQSDFCL